MWKSRCAVTNCRFGGHVILTLTRWDADKPPVMSNLVLMMQAQAQILHEKGQGAFDAATVDKIRARLDWAKAYLEEEESIFSRGLNDGKHLASLDSGKSPSLLRRFTIVGGALSLFAVALCFNK